MAQTASFELPRDADNVTVALGPRQVRLTNLSKPFFPRPGHTKRDLLRYYASVAPWLLPHLKDRPMVMRRYPDGVDGEAFFMKRTPAYAPEWLQRCEVTHRSRNVIDFPLVQDLASLLWVVNLGCIDLNPWYSRCDDLEHPDFLVFDLDPGAKATFAQVRESGLVVHEALASLGMTGFAKTSGSRGLHVFVPLVRGPASAQVLAFAKAFCEELAWRNRSLLTAEFGIARRPVDRVFLDFNQNARTRTLASVYSVRATANATVSMPVSWAQLAGPVAMNDFRLDNVPALLQDAGDAWEPLLAKKGRFDLRRFV